MKCLENMERIQIPNTLMIQLFNLYENKGRAFYYKEFFERDDEIMARQTIEEDVQAIGELFDLNITPTRLKLLSNTRRKYVPKNKDERFLLNIKEALIRIQRYATEFKLTIFEVRDLTTILFRGYDDIKFKKEGKRSRKTVTSFEEKPSEEQLELLISKYHEIRRSNKYELLMIVTNFFVDFIKIEPFNKYNHEIAILVVYTMLAKEFQVFRYESFFQTFVEKKDKFDLGLSQAYYDWENGLSQTDSIVRVFVEVIEILNDSIKTKEHMYKFELTMNKTDNVGHVIYNGPSVFTKQDIRNQLPLVSDSTINRTLQDLRKKGVIRPLGKGRSAQWQRLKEHEKSFSVEQLSIFE